MKWTITSILGIIVILLAACSSDKNPLASTAHEDGWMDVTSTVFHASKVETIGAVTCRSCHGVNTDSGESGTFCVDCHDKNGDASYPHPTGWAEFDNSESHLLAPIIIL